MRLGDAAPCARQSADRLIGESAEARSAFHAIGGGSGAGTNAR